MSPEPGEAAAGLIAPRLRAALAASTGRPFVVGLCGAQGSGKSTLARLLAQRFATEGLRVATLSIDDIYLSRDDREHLAATVHPLFATRGVPGTHDVALGEAVIDACAGKGMVALPRFAKEEDRRRPPEQWDHVEGPVDLLLFEGWCVGARAQPEAALEAPVNALEAREDRDGGWRHAVNARLADDYRHLFARVDFLVLLAAPDFSVVAGWRKQQEHELRARLAREGCAPGATMDDAGVERFIQHYQRITQAILAEMPARADLVIDLDSARRPSLRATGSPSDATV